MAEDYANTIFDATWRPYDVLEDLLAKTEGEIKLTEDQILNSATPITSALLRKFCWGLAVAACRFPRIMKRAHRRRIGLAYALAEIGRMDRIAFEAKLASFGQVLTDA